MVILDTNVVIDHLRLLSSKDSKLVKLAEQLPKENFAISMITVQELYEGQSTKDEKIEQVLLSTIAPMTILPYTFDVAKKAGQINRDTKQTIGLGDAAIAAAAVINGASLYTLNKRHFQGIKGLELLDLTRN
ncbi:PIN domain-containing protein [Patescibacteria group bacterium]|nr:PIN domain-containing protein [Patescibacteria group bacterium]